MPGISTVNSAVFRKSFTTCHLTRPKTQIALPIPVRTPRSEQNPVGFLQLAVRVPDQCPCGTHPTSCRATRRQGLRGGDSRTLGTGERRPR